MTRVRAPSRLHFGLLHVPTPETPADARLFGGIGLMVNAPGVTVQVSQADEWTAIGPSADRALEFAQRFVYSLPADCQRPFRVKVESCPVEHIGLGVGTQLGLAVAKAISLNLQLPHFSAVELAERVGRGLRSGIGVYGFDGGGLIFDAGKRNGEAISQLHSRQTLPEEWRLVLACPREAKRWHGEVERRAFAQPTRTSTQRLQKLFEGLLQLSEYRDFGSALHEYNREAGNAFLEAQGGIYSSPDVAKLIHQIQDLGILAVGQSSWGPTVFALTPDEARADWLVQQLNELNLDFVLATQPNNLGAVCVD